MSMTKPARLGGSKHREPGHVPADTLGKGDRAQSSGAAAHYIGTLTNELARLAREHRLDLLAYILDMARLEANQIAKNPNPGPHA
jgi:hypothetical protein